MCPMSLTNSFANDQLGKTRGVSIPCEPQHRKEFAHFHLNVSPPLSPLLLSIRFHFTSQQANSKLRQEEGKKEIKER